MTPSAPTPSVIIPTLNAEKPLPSLLESLLSQSVPGELIVIDSSSSDRTAAIAASFGAKVIRIGRGDFDHGGTRNLGVRASSGGIIVFLTQDAVPRDRSLIENLLQPLLDGKAALSYGRQIPKSDATPPERFVRTFNYPETPRMKGREDLGLLGIKTFYCSNVCSAVRRREFEEVGGFPDKIILNEDMVLASRLILRGYRVAYQPSAAVYHSHNYSLTEQFKRYFDIGVSLNRNRSILDFVRPEGEGVRVIREEMTYLAAQGQWRWMPYALIDAVVRYAGYRLGLLEDRIPGRLKMRLSMHKHFWRGCGKI